MLSFTWGISSEASTALREVRQEIFIDADTLGTPMILGRWELKEHENRNGI
jgi:hypothetical protein